jgi:hypothetical protein
VKHCMADVVPSLVRILNRSFETAVVPANMKKSRVVPVFKSGDRTNPNSYRPISAILLVSKIMEKIVFKRLTVFLFANFSLFSKQYGFVSGLSTESALFDLISDIQCSLDQRLRTVGVFYDICKAFISVDHNFLLTKPRCFGIRKWVQIDVFEVISAVVFNVLM